jgi:hypothetical protein
LGRWTPIAELPGMGRPVDTAAVSARRRALLRRMGAGIALIPAAHTREIEHDHMQDNDFRQDDTFFYFTGLESHDAWLLLTVAPESAHTTLLLPVRDTAEERWTGIQLGPDSVAVRLTGIRDVIALDSLAARLGVAARDTGPIYLPLDALTADERRAMEAALAGRDLRDLYPLADSLRLVKDADELRRLRMAIESPYWAIWPACRRCGRDVGIPARSRDRGHVPRQRRGPGRVPVFRGQRTKRRHAPLRHEPPPDASG